MTKPSLQKLIEILKSDKDIARYESHLEKKCLYDVENKKKFSTEVKDHFHIVERGIEELEKGIHGKRRVPFRYGTDKYDLSVKAQKEVQAVLRDYLVPSLVLLLGNFCELEDKAHDEIMLRPYCGAASPSGNSYALSNEPIFLVPREDRTVIFVNAKRRKNKKETQWITDIVGDYPFAELEERTTLEFRNNYFNYVYYIDGAEEYPIEETILPVIERKYDRLFGG